MTADTQDELSDALPSEAIGPVSPRHRRRRVLIAAVVAAVLAVGIGAVNVARPYGISLVHPFGLHHRPGTGNSAGNGAATTTAAVAHRTLSAQTSVGGTLGYAGDYTVLGAGHGMVTALPAVGHVVHQGEALYELDGAPVVLLRGSTPAYRSLARGAEASSVRGRDVRQLNADLVALGYADHLGLDPTSDRFLWATKAAVKRLQKHLGVAQTGELALGQLVFLPTAARVTKLTAQLGGPAAGPVLSATSTTRVVTVKLEAARQSQVKVGDRVTITLPDTSTTRGVVSRVGTVATSADSAAGSGSPTIEVNVTPGQVGTSGRLDQAPVQVAITTGTVRDALVVPVTALLALVGGGYAVEVVDSDATHRLLPVSLGLTDDGQGLVQVTGSGLSAGQRVMVPAT